ncbi:hypothetical protein D3C81_2034710 [compost metagenome]
MQLLVGNRAFELFAFAAAQGQQDPAVRTGLGGDLVVGEQGRKFFLDQAHVVQLRDDLNGVERPLQPLCQCFYLRNINKNQ